MSAKAEKIARMMGKGAYRDLREGLSRGGLVHDPDADIKAALGIAQSVAGQLAVQTLETRYASTLRHERAIRRAWAERMGTCYQHLDPMAVTKQTRIAKGDGHHVAIGRMGCAIAIRKLAGSMAVADTGEYAWLLNCRRAMLDIYIIEAEVWLDDVCARGERAFVRALRDEEAA